jgi:hypothetical protein
MTEKNEYIGRESGKSSSKWFGRSEPAGTAGGDHGYGARTGDGKTTDKNVAGKIEVEFQPGKKD